MLEPDTERQLAADLFNQVWELLETPDRTTEQDDRMIHAAHASRLHWESVGRPENLAVGEWQCSRVYSVLGRPEPAAHHARRSLAICEDAEIRGFVRAAAYEALTRASLVAGDRSAADRWAALARQEAERIDDPEDLETFEGDMATLPGSG